MRESLAFAAAQEHQFGPVREQRREIGLGEGVEAPGCPRHQDLVAREHDVLADLLGPHANPACAGGGDDDAGAAVEGKLHVGGWCIAVNPRIR